MNCCVPGSMHQYMHIDNRGIAMFIQVHDSHMLRPNATSAIQVCFIKRDCYSHDFVEMVHRMSSERFAVGNDSHNFLCLSREIEVEYVKSSPFKMAFEAPH